MCEFSDRLVAWIDGEVAGAEAAEIARHIATCAECRNCAAEFRKVSGEFAEYCEEVAHAAEVSNAVRRQYVLLAAAAAILLAATFAYWRRHAIAPVQEPDAHAVAAKTDSGPSLAPAVVTGAPTPRTPEHRHRAQRVANVNAKRAAASPRLCSGQDCAGSERQAEGASWVAVQPAVEIAIPVDAMFPPGAVPEGMNFVADMSIGADGAAEQLRLRPRTERFVARQEEK